MQHKNAHLATEACVVDVFLKNMCSEKMKNQKHFTVHNQKVKNKKKCLKIEVHGHLKASNRMKFPLKKIKIKK